MSEEKAGVSVLLSALDNYGGHPFDEVFDIVFPCYGVAELKEVQKLSDKPALVIWGGADISPTIYNQVPNKFNSAGVALSSRDQLEFEMASEAMRLGIPIIGICRGAQLMCALSGGKLIQHVDNHANGWHDIECSDGQKLYCPSLHHQMMYPWTDGDAPKVEFEMLAWCPKPRSSVYFGEPLENAPEKCEELKVPQEPEVIWFPKTKSLCIQSHPEFIDNMKHPFIKYTLELTKHYILNDKDSNRS